MMTLIAAALVAAQPAPATDPHAQHSNMPARYGLGNDAARPARQMMMDCCKNVVMHMKASMKGT